MYVRVVQKIRLVGETGMSMMDRARCLHSTIIVFSKLPRRIERVTESSSERARVGFVGNTAQPRR